MPSDIIIDTDPGVDDAVAILYALNSPELRVRALVTVHGNSTVQSSTRNLATLLEALHRHRTTKGDDNSEWHRPVVAVGAESPLKMLRYDAEFFHGEGGLGGVHSSHPHWTRDLLLPSDIVEPHPLYDISERDGPDEILHQLRTQPANTITLVGIGPLTNFALAIERDAKTFARARRIVCLGGALLVPGNVTPTTEFNFWADPHAADIVLRRTSLETPEDERMEVILVPQDVFYHVRVPRSLLDHCSSQYATPIAEFYAAISRYAYGVMKQQNIDELCLADVATIQLIIDLAKDPEQRLSVTGQFGWQIKREDIRVETEGNWTRGMCLIDRRFGDAHAITVVEAYMTAEAETIINTTNDAPPLDVLLDPHWLGAPGATQVYACYKMDFQRCSRDLTARIFGLDLDSL